ncbi:hypothetical protein [Pararhodobacter sp.]|uniref:hypothetical protein n=1 Tax=Pararhodobacter sp. TaxID=2127056 RepID=UPI002AFF503C|nr:hypothetical protein [Pararhodobacter sp.]
MFRKLSAATFVAFALAITSVGAIASDFTIKSDNLAPAFNKAAKKLGADNRMVRGKCQSEVKFVCQYEAGSGVSLLAVADNPKNKDISSIRIVYASKDRADVMNFAETVGVLMALLVPAADKDERGAAMVALLSRLKDADEGNVDLHDVNFRIRAAADIGVVTTVTKP